MKKYLTRESNTITVANFWENYLLNKYNFDPPYQRKSVWTDEKQSFFVDTVLKNFPIPPIFLHQIIDDQTGATKYDLIDGKQRLTSLVRFIKNEIPVSNEFGTTEFDDDNLSGSYFKDLEDTLLVEYKKRFWRYLIPIEYIDTSSTATIDNIFDRLNRNGEALRGQELRNAKFHNSALLDLVEKLSDMEFWKQRLDHVDLKRMENYEFISELLFVILEDGPQHANQKIIDDLYEKYVQSNNKWPEIEIQFNNITNFLQQLEIEYDTYKIKGVSHLYGLWCFAWYCTETDILIETVKTKICELFSKLRENNTKDYWINEYRKSMSARTKDKGQRTRRLEALLHFCEILK